MIEALYRDTSDIEKFSQLTGSPDTDSWCGTDTGSAVQQGALLALGAAVSKAAGRLGRDTKIVLTGGDASVLQPVIGTDAEIRPLLVLEGLQHVKILTTIRKQSTGWKSGVFWVEHIKLQSVATNSTMANSIPFTRMVEMLQNEVFISRKHWARLSPNKLGTAISTQGYIFVCFVFVRCFDFVSVLGGDRTSNLKRYSSTCGPLNTSV